MKMMNNIKSQVFILWRRQSEKCNRVGCGRKKLLMTSGSEKQHKILKIVGSNSLSVIKSIRNYFVNQSFTLSIYKSRYSSFLDMNMFFFPSSTVTISRMFIWVDQHFLHQTDRLIVSCSPVTVPFMFIDLSALTWLIHDCGIFSSPWFNLPRIFWIRF